jgi:hypothetical protein
MPTGYTSGILNGSITTLKEFAKRCSRAYVMHMRDEPRDAEYKDSEPGMYYKVQKEEALSSLALYAAKTDQELVDDLLQAYKDRVTAYTNAIGVCDANRVILNKFLEKAKKVHPPTKAHINISTFMVEQIEQTIDSDADSSHHKTALKTLLETPPETDPKVIRESVNKDLHDTVDRCEKSYKEEVKRCKNQNDWYYAFTDSIED